MLALLAGGCLAEDALPEPIATTAAPIINGTFEAGDLAVVGLADTNSPDRNTLFCTGTLVSKHVVVAAGHCVSGGAPPGYIYFGSDPAAGGEFVAVKSAVAHPGFNQNLDNDISVVLLQAPAPANVVPYAMAASAPTVGQSARFVGFGCRAIGNCGPYGEKYVVSAGITEVNANDFAYGVATCNGDSGGPAFVMQGGREVLEGVTSWGDQDCSQFGYDTRVDVYAAWVQGFIDTEDPATCAGGDSCKTDCESFDPDCPRVPDGAACDEDLECQSGVCEGVCRALCDPAGAACADGLSCEEQEGGAHACVEGGGGGGCGCRAGGQQGGLAGGALAAVLALLGAVFLGRRRRRG